MAVESKLSKADVVGCLGGCLGLLVTTPIFLFLLYQILVRVDADAKMWTAFWVYVPVTFIVGASREVYRALKDKPNS